MAPLLYADLVLVAAVAALLAVLTVLRARSRGRAILEAAARERFETLIAEQLVSEEEVAVPESLSALERRVLLAVGTAALFELRGRERDSLANLVEQTGLVAERAAVLRRGRAPNRRHAADLLGLIASPGTRAPLRAALDDPDPLVRLAAARGLAEAGDEGAITSVAAVTDATVDRATGAVAELVLALGTRAPGALPALYESTGSDAVRRLIVSVIGQLRLSAHAPLLRHALAGDDELAARAARGLGQIGDVRATSDLLDLLADPTRSWYLHAAVATALGQLGDPAAVDALGAELRRDNWTEQRAAAEALARLGPPGRTALEDALERDGVGMAHDLVKAALDR